MSTFPARTAFLALAAIAGLGGCDDVASPASAIPPFASISDAAHEGRNEHFYFLSPIVPAPRTSGTFDGTQSPVVTVCEWTSAGCGATVAEFTMSAGSGGESIRSDAANEQYHVNWHTDQCVSGPCSLASSSVYRLRVLLHGVELGHADLIVGSSQRELRNVDTEDYITLVNGRTLPVRFRIEVGAIGASTTFEAAPSTEAQTLTTPSTTDGSVALELPGGSLTQPMTITVERTDVPASVSAGVVAGATYEFGPDGTQFATPVALTISYNPANLPAETAETALGLYALVGDLWQLVPGSRVDAANNTVTGFISHFSTYGVRASASVSAGWYHSCGLGTKGDAVCWGFGEALGNGTGVSSLTPVAVAGGIALTGVDAGNTQSCGIANGTLYCWGSDSTGGFWGGAGTILTPLAAPAGSPTTFTSVDASHFHTCALASGVIQCRFGGMLMSHQLVPLAGPEALTTMTAGGPDVCGTSASGRLYCWTYDMMREVVVSGATFTQASAGGHHTCALTGVGDIHCWGTNDVGQLGDGSTTSSPSPVRVVPPSPVTFTAVSAGYQHTCGLTTTGSIYCWGDNSAGQLGDGSAPSTAWYAPTPVPVLVSSALGFESLSAGFAHTCAISTAPSQPKSTAYCWGSNSHGQLGNGTTTQSSVPVEVTTIP